MPTSISFTDNSSSFRVGRANCPPEKSYSGSISSSAACRSGVTPPTARSMRRRRPVPSGQSLACPSSLPDAPFCQAPRRHGIARLFLHYPPIACTAEYCSYSITAAIAATIDRMPAGDTSPNFRTNRCVSTPRSCNVSTAEAFVSPFLLSGVIFTPRLIFNKVPRLPCLTFRCRSLVMRHHLPSLFSHEASALCYRQQHEILLKRK